MNSNLLIQRIIWRSSHQSRFSSRCDQPKAARSNHFRLASICTIFLGAAGAIVPALANQSITVPGAIDKPIQIQSKNQAKIEALELKKQVKIEQRELAKASRNEVKKRAENGERLAQVEVGNDFAKEAQTLTFAPAAANAAISDALQWYNLAAQRGFPGAPSLDQSGVSFYPVRIVRSRN